MNIALIANDAKKDLMVEFCIAYCGVLSKHTIMATGITGKLIEEATGLKIHRFLSGEQGGQQQISASVACGEVDILLLFRDPLKKSEASSSEASLLRLCDVHNIPVATNIATAEAIIHCLGRGDLDYLDIIHPKNK